MNYDSIWDNFEINNNKKFKLKKILRKLNISPLKKNTNNFLNWFS